MRPRRSWPLALGAAAALGGCAGPPPDAGFRSLAAAAPSGAVAAADLCPLTPGRWTYEITRGGGAGAAVVRRRAGTQEYGAAWVEHEDDRRREYWRLDESGHLVMPVAVDVGQQAVTFFEPPLVVAYRRLEPDGPRQQEVRMRVMDASRPQHQRHEGTATRRIEYVDDRLIETPLGRFRTRRVEVSFEADLGLAGAENSATFYVAPGLGPVVIERDETWRVMGVPVRTRAQTLVLRSAPQAPAPAADATAAASRSIAPDG